MCCDNIKENDKVYLQKRIETLKGMLKDLDSLSILNIALLDEREGTKEMKKIDKQFIFQNIICKTVKVGEQIKNKSSMRIVFILDDTDMKPENNVIFEQIYILISKGHDVLIYSCFPKPEDLNCDAYYFSVHPDIDISTIVAKPDIVIAGNWSLVPLVLKIKAPLKYVYISDEPYLYKYEKLDEELKNAIKAAFIAPIKLLTPSSKISNLIFDLFGRPSVLVSSDLSPNAKVKNLETEFIKAVRTTIQAIKLYNVN